MKTILFLVPGSDMGGIATAFTALANFLENKGYVINVLLPYAEDIQETAIPKRYIRGAVFKKRIRNRFLLRGLNLFNLLTKWKYYFTFSYSTKFKYDIFALYQGMSYSHWIKYSKAKVNIGWFHGALRETKNRLWHRSISICYNKFNKLIAVSDEIVEGWRAFYDIRGPIQVIPNLIDIEAITALSKMSQCEIKQGSTPKFICVARLSQEKGVMRLLNVVNCYYQMGYKFSLYFVGDGPLKTLMQAFIKEHNLSDCCHLLGAKTNPYTYMRAVDALILPSYTEGLGLVLWEALLVGTPVLSTDCGGTRLALKAGAWGMLTENNDEIFQESFGYLLENYKKIKELTNFQQIRSELNCLNEKNKKALLQLLRSLDA